MKEILDPKQVKLEMTNIGEVMIDSLMFTFGVESVGKASDKGFCVSISGDAVSDGRVTFSDFQIIRQIKGKTVTKYEELSEFVKNDGKMIYQARFENINIVEASDEEELKKLSEEQLIQKVNSQITFKLVPHFSGDDMPEIMISIYPFQNILTGAATEWVYVTSDKDYFANRLKNGKKKKGKGLYRK